MPWWGWLLAVVFGLALFVFAAWRSWRRTVRREVVEFLREHYPDIEILDERDGSISFRRGEVDGRGMLANVYEAVSGLGTDDAEGRREIYKQWAESAVQGAELLSQPFSLKTHGDHLFPRLVPPGFLEDRPDGPLPHRDLESLGLAVVYVIDLGPSVGYVTQSILEELGLDAAALHERALENLAKVSPGEDFVSDVTTGGSMALLKGGDSHDAARLLLVPRYLRPGQEVAAVIPDRDTCALMPVPSDGDWTGPLELARTPDSEHLLIDRPLRVTRAGFEVVHASGFSPTIATDRM